jgi:hypothetical protein
MQPDRFFGIRDLYSGGSHQHPEPVLKGRHHGIRSAEGASVHDGYQRRSLVAASDVGMELGARYSPGRRAGPLLNMAQCQATLTGDD